MLISVAGHDYAVDLTRDEERALAGEDGEALQTAYRVLLAAGEAGGADRLVPVRWAHLSGVNYNTIGEAGEEFLASLAASGARAAVRATLNPMGYDADSVGRYGLPGGFVKGQESIRRSYEAMGVDMSFSCVPYEIYGGDMVPRSQVAFAESNAAIYANSLASMRTNKESAFSALASALTGKSPATGLRKEGGEAPAVSVRMCIEDPTEMDYGMLGYFAGRQAGGSSSVAISGMRGRPDMRSCKSLCGGMGTSGTCAKFVAGEAAGGEGAAERVEFGADEARAVRDELGTADSGDLVVLGSPQLGLGELGDLAGMLGGRRFAKRCMVFCPRAVQADAARLGYAGAIERAGGELLYDCCACLTPLIRGRKSRGGDMGGVEADAVTTNSIKGAYYLNSATGVGVNLKPLAEIVRDETR